MAYWFPCNFVSPGVLVLHCSTGIYSTGVMVLPGILCSLESGAPLPHWNFAPLEPCSPGAPMPSGVLVLHCSTGALLPWSTAPRSLLESKCSLESHSPIVLLHWSLGAPWSLVLPGALVPHYSTVILLPWTLVLREVKVLHCSAGVLLSRSLAFPGVLVLPGVLRSLKPRLSSSPGAAPASPPAGRPRLFRLVAPPPLEQILPLLLQAAQGCCG